MENKDNIDKNTNKKDDAIIIETNFRDEMVQEALTKAGVKFDLGEEKILENEKIREDLVLESNYKDGVDYFQKFDYIPLKDLHEMPEVLNFFPKPSKSQLLDLVTSIEALGVIMPLLIMDSDDGDGYIVITGRSRMMALNQLYSISNNPKYEKAPCMILDSTKIDVLMIQNIIITTNLQYRTLDRETIIKALTLQHRLLRSAKKFRGEYNITRTLASRFKISKTTVEDYLCLEKLHPDVRKKVFAKKITLQVGKALSKADHEKQLAIVQILGEKKINDVEKVRALSEPKFGRFLDPVTKTLVNHTWETKVERVLRMTPPTTKIHLEIANGATEATLKALLSARKAYAIEEMKSYPGDNSNEFFKISVNKNDLDQYAEAGLIDKELIKNIRQTSFDNIIKHKC